MAPETRSSASKRTKTLGGHGEEVEPDKQLKKRQKRPLFSDESYLPSKACMDRYYSRFISGEIVPGRFIDLCFFTQERFQFGKWFKDMNWVSVVLMKQKFYPELVRHFYANLSYDANKSQLCSFVKGKEIRLDQKLSSKILGIPNLGTEIYDNNKWVEEETGVSRVEALRMIHDDPDLSKASKVNACHLKLEMRLLHHMVVHIILPRKRSSNYVSSMDLLVMWHILKGKPLNLSFVLLSHMIACSEKKNVHLPYGMILTSIFNHFEVSLEGEESEELKGSDIYNEVTLHNMGYVKNERGWFLKKDKAVVQSQQNQIDRETRNVTLPSASLTPLTPPNSPPQPTPSHGITSMSVPNATSSASPFPLVCPIEEGQPSEEARHRNMIECVSLLVKGMKEDMRTMNTDSKGEDLRNKMENLQSLVTQLRGQQKERTIGDIFRLLEFIMADMRNLRSKMDSFRSKIDSLHSQLTEFLRQRHDLVEVLKEIIEWMIAETVNFRGHNRDIVCCLETISSEIQDFWDCLSSRTGGKERSFRGNLAAEDH